MKNVLLAGIASLFPVVAAASTMPQTFIYDLTITTGRPDFQSLLVESYSYDYADLPASDQANCEDWMPGVSCPNYIPSILDVSGTDLNPSPVTEAVQLVLRTDGTGSCNSDLIYICNSALPQIGSGNEMRDITFDIFANAKGFVIDALDASFQTMISFSSAAYAETSEYVLQVEKDGFFIRENPTSLRTLNFVVALNGVTVVAADNMVAPVPLPAGLPLLAAGLGGLALLRARRNT
ncbi:VPLPA-CTERM sorting domain-containing protein [uncultured Jannaschia sp.]|uniref:VPLPA-CTERM sorting domain-containing protein n=1 Tax=uncultured Jannaschia sp. TaxID=293347 RepID=UPI00260A204E|nr:VPLPA-CTERM sorting domain-containing protein [uncultured Jannaschia sp.]